MLRESKKNEGEQLGSWAYGIEAGLETRWRHKSVGTQHGLTGVTAQASAGAPRDPAG